MGKRFILVIAFKWDDAEGKVHHRKDLLKLLNIINIGKHFRHHLKNPQQYSNNVVQTTKKQVHN